MRIVQFFVPGAGRRLGLVVGDQLLDVTSVDPALRSTYAAFQESQRLDLPLVTVLRSRCEGAQTWSYTGLLTAEPVADNPHLLPPLDHPDPYRTLVTGTGLTHLGSMQSRNQMHVKAAPSHAASAPATDSAKMFQMGLEGGRPAAGECGVAPEWFYKGNGNILRGPGATLEVPDFALDGGEEPEIVGCYVIGATGVPVHIGFALGNEWSDHPTEKINYLYLAPSKLRTCAVGPELVIGHSFQEIALRCTVSRLGTMLYDSGVLYSGETHMCHSLANLEDHHFKYPEHRHAGDVHLHFFGTSKLSYGSRSWTYESGDVVRIESDAFSAPLVNFVRRHAPRSRPVTVRRGIPES